MRVSKKRKGAGSGKTPLKPKPGKCPGCGKPVEGTPKACPACGANLDPGATRQV